MAIELRFWGSLEDLIYIYLCKLYKDIGVKGMLAFIIFNYNNWAVQEYIKKVRAIMPKDY